MQKLTAGINFKFNSQYIYLSEFFAEDFVAWSYFLAGILQKLVFKMVRFCERKILSLLLSFDATVHNEI